MRIAIYAASLLPFTAALAACSGSHGVADAKPPSTSAHHIVIVDVSASSAALSDVLLRQAVQRRITADLKKSLQLGDRITYYEAGSRNAERMVATLDIKTGYSQRVPAALTKLSKAMGGSATKFESTGGDGGTNLLLAMETIQPSCAARSTVTVSTDGIEESDAYSTSAALNAGKPVTLPSPPTAYLSGCHVRLVGLGLTGGLSGQNQVLPAAQLAALRKGWTAYLQAAGVAPDAIEFVSAL